MHDRYYVQWCQLELSCARISLLLSTLYRSILQIKSHGQKIASRLEAGDDVFEELRTVKGRAIVQRHLSSEHMAARVLCELKQSFVPSQAVFSAPLTASVQS
jgi:hypothetical protein